MEQPRSLVRTNDVSIHYRISIPDNAVSRQRPALILIHGVASNLTRWTEFLKQTSLTNHYRIIRLDLRGHARSQTDVGVGMDNWCNDIDALLQQENIDQAVIVGHSLGAQVGLNFAHRFRHRTAGLVLIDPIVPTALKGFLALGPYLRWIISLLADTSAFFRRLGFGRRKFSLRDLYQLDQATRVHIKGNPNADLARLYHSPTADMHFIPFSNYARDMSEVLRPLPPLPVINLPTLAILARNPSVSDANMNRTVLSTMPDIRFATIDADHWPLTEQPVATREAIDKWCLQRIAEKQG